MDGIFTRTFWKAAAERMAKTAAQFVLFAWGLTGVVDGSGDVPDAFAFDWKLGLGAALAGAVLSLGTSLMSAPVGPQGSPSLVVDRDGTVHPDAA